MMAVINKADVKKPMLPKETVTCAALGGDVIVTGLNLKDRVSIYSVKDGASISLMLSLTVVDAAGESIFTEAEWDDFGAQQFNACVELFQVAKRLSGLDASIAEKNS